MTVSINQSTDSRLIASGKVEGVHVYNRQGDRLGTINDIYIDKVSGQAEFASLAFGGFLGAGQKLHSLPWSVLNYNTEMDGFVVDLDKKILEKAPTYSHDELAGSEANWTEKVRDYYAVA